MEVALALGISLAGWLFVMSLRLERHRHRHEWGIWKSERGEVLHSDLVQYTQTRYCQSCGLAQHRRTRRARR